MARKKTKKKKDTSMLLMTKSAKVAPFDDFADEHEIQHSKQSLTDIIELVRNLADFPRALPYIVSELPKDQQKVAYANLAIQTARDLDEAKKTYGEKSYSVAVLEQLLNYCMEKAGDHFKE